MWSDFVFRGKPRENSRTRVPTKARCGPRGVVRFRARVDGSIRRYCVQLNAREPTATAAVRIAPRGMRGISILATCIDSVGQCFLP